MKLRYTGFFVPDVPAAVAFYESAFGLGLHYMHPSRGYAELDTGETLLFFTAEAFVAEAGLLGGLPVRVNRPDLDPVAAHIAFVTDDVDRAFDRALAAGATAVKRPEAKPWGQTAGYLRDPDGILVELTTPSVR